MYIYNIIYYLPIYKVTIIMINKWLLQRTPEEIESMRNSTVRYLSWLGIYKIFYSKILYEFSFQYFNISIRIVGLNNNIKMKNIFPSMEF